MTKTRKSHLERLADRICATGDLGSEFTQAFDLTHSIALKTCGANSLEVAQEAAIKIVASVDDFPSMPDDSRRALATKIVKTTNIDMIRSSKHCEQATDEVLANLQYNDMDSVLDQIVDQEWQEGHKEWLERQPPRDQEIWSLRSEEMSLKQIADQTDLAKSTVGHRMETLKKSYKSFFSGD